VLALANRLTARIPDANLGLVKQQEPVPMKTSAALLALGLTFSSGLSASAQTTPDEAQRLTGLFQSYFGAEPGVVTVTPSGPSYATRIDLMPLIGKMQVPGFSASVTRVELTITPQGPGKWQVDQNQPLSAAVRVEGQFDMKAQIGTIAGTGIFDEALGTFASTSAEFRAIAVEQTITQQNQVERSSYTIASLKVQSASNGMGGNVDGSSTQSYSGFRQTTSILAAADGSAPALDFTVSSPAGTQTTSYSGHRVEALNDLLIWAMAHASREKLVNGQAELKDKLRAALPIFSRISSTSTQNAITVNSVIGQFSADKIDTTFNATGIVSDGMVRAKLTVSGFKPPEGIVPPFAASLIPENFSIDSRISDFDLKAPVSMIIDTFDLSTVPLLPSNIEALLPLTLTSADGVIIELGLSEVIAKAFDFKAEGKMTAGGLSAPAGSALLKLKGLDETMAALQAAPPEMGMAQMMPVILLAKGLAKQEADGYLAWTIESTPQGSVTINGNDLSKITGGQ